MTSSTAHSNAQKKHFGLLPQECVPGAVLLASAALAMLVINSPFASIYKNVLATSFSIGPTGGGVEMSVAYWIKNALMAIFFFFVGLELKREILEGQLSNPKAAALPVLAALGGMVVPALIYLMVAGAHGFGQGWAIPSATDIAFALGVLSLLGNRVPPALKAFLLAVAVVDDLGAIVIVAVFYSKGLVLIPLLGASCVSLILVIMNRLKLRNIGLFVLIGCMLWVFMHQSGISATISGVIVAACVPLKCRQGTSPLEEAEHDFRPWVLYGIMPIFAFANAGVSLEGADAFVLHPVALGIAFGLALGKPIGITALTYLAAAIMRAKPPGSLWQIVGVGCIAGVGFTMSFFVGALAFKGLDLATPVRLGVYAGSLFSALLGLAILARTLPKTLTPEDALIDDETAPFMAPDPDFAQRDRTPV